MALALLAFSCSVMVPPDEFSLCDMRASKTSAELANTSKSWLIPRCDMRNISKICNCNLLINMLHKSLKSTNGSALFDGIDQYIVFDDLDAKTPSNFIHDELNKTYFNIYQCFSPSLLSQPHCSSPSSPNNMIKISINIYSSSSFTSYYPILMTPKTSDAIPSQRLINVNNDAQTAEPYKSCRATSVHTIRAGILAHTEFEVSPTRGCASPSMIRPDKHAVCVRISTVATEP